MIATPFGRAALLGGAGGCVPFSQIDGSVSEGATFTHPADGVIAWTQTTMGGGGGIVSFRRVDDTHSWDIYSSAGFMALRENNGGSTNRATWAGGADGQRTVVVCEAALIQVYVNGVLRMSYASASAYATQTEGKNSSLGTGGVVTDLKTWALACRASEGV